MLWKFAEDAIPQKVHVVWDPLNEGQYPLAGRLLTGLRLALSKRNYSARLNPTGREVKIEEYSLPQVQENYFRKKSDNLNRT